MSKISNLFKRQVLVSIVNIFKLKVKFSEFVASRMIKCEEVMMREAFVKFK